MKISKSKINTFAQCHRRFKWQYLDYRIPDLPPAPVTQVGIDIHKIFDSFYDSIDVKSIPPSNPYQYFMDALEVLPQYRGIWQMFCDWNARRWNSDSQFFMPVVRELKLNVGDLVGVIDRINYDGEDYTIIDYKSHGNSLQNKRFELNFYKLLVDGSNFLDKPVKYIGVYGYTDGEYTVEKINTRSFNSMLSKVEKFRETDFSELDYSASRSYACRWCGYEPSCRRLE